MGGRFYARQVESVSVKTVVNRLEPSRVIKLECEESGWCGRLQKILETLANKEVNANFIEGMGCVGGCVGGLEQTWKLIRLLVLSMSLLKIPYHDTLII